MQDFVHQPYDSRFSIQIQDLLIGLRGLSFIGFITVLGFRLRQYDAGNIFMYLTETCRPSALKPES